MILELPNGRQVEVPDAVGDAIAEAFGALKAEQASMAAEMRAQLEAVRAERAGKKVQPPPVVNVDLSPLLAAVQAARTENATLLKQLIALQSAPRVLTQDEYGRPMAKIGGAGE